MAEFNGVPIVEVHNDNFRELWPSIILAINSSTFVAIDAELSGLGNRKLLNAKSVDVRYKEMCDVAKSRSIISLGLSCFKLNKSTDERDNSDLDFQVQTFNITLLCSENYTVEPLSLTFLVEHGFDFNKQYSKGIPYYRGQDKEDDKEYQSIRRLFCELIRSAVPVVLHNGLVDLVFLYQNLYTDVPSSFQKFTADLSEIYAGGIYDTKYISEFKSRMSASYLEYIFRKSQRENWERAENGQQHVCLKFLNYPESMADVVLLPCGLQDQPQLSEEGKANPCFHFAAHGWCPKGNNCAESHDIDCILDKESIKKRRKQRKRKPKADPVDNISSIDISSDNLARETTFGNKCDTKSDFLENKGEETTKDLEKSQYCVAKDMIGASSENRVNEESTNNHTKLSPVTPNPISRRVGGHRAGYDSFMTGYAFAYTIAKFGTSQGGEESLDDFGLQDLTNKVALGGKDFPLLIQKSNFSKTSNAHNVKIEKVRSCIKT